MPPLKSITQGFKLGRNCTSSRRLLNRHVPNFRNTFNKARKVHPIVFEAKHLCLRYVGSNDYNTRHVIRGGTCKRHYQGIGVIGGPSNRRKKPINLLEQWISLYTRPSILTTLDWQFNKTQLPNYFIKQKHLIDIATRLIAVVDRPHKVKISKKKPFIIRSNVKVI